MPSPRLKVSRLSLVLLLLPLVFQSFRLHGVTNRNIAFTHKTGQEVVATILPHDSASSTRYGFKSSSHLSAPDSNIATQLYQQQQQQQQQQPPWSSSTPHLLPQPYYDVSISTHNHTTVQFPLDIHMAKNGDSFLNTSDLYDMYENQNNSRSMGKFHYQHAPILLWKAATLTAPVRVRILLFQGPHTIVFRKGPTGAIGDEMLNIVMDGLQKSPYFELLNDEPELIDETTSFPEKEEGNTTPIIWIIDMRRMFERQKEYSIPEQTLDLANKTVAANPSLRDGNLKVVFLDYRDKVYSLCRRNKGRAVRQLIDLLGSEHVRQVNQQVVNTRKWDAHRNFVVPGHVINGFPCFDYPALHIPYTVRSEYADAVRQNYASLLPADMAADDDVSSPCDTERPIDVAHFWNVQDKHSFCKLRNGVNKVLLEDLANKTGGIRNILADFVSKGGGSGRTSLQLGYVQALLQSKIVVVAQRDQWEDHYRFFEAIIGGALVLTDPMLSLPKGYVNGTNIVIYESFDQLRELILYYLEHPEERLEIARRGWELAVREHRSYHWMEKLFFGRSLSK
jgi:hypothetical protein